ncbi:MAG: dUTP diphosphatase [Candidatus Diapherotrites archaeon]|nr:dUTP diphosphatase [Candidatus Diapherotrites archaeon]
MKILVKKLSGDAIVPAYAHKGDSGMDLFANETAELQPGERRLVKTGIAIAVPHGFEAQVRPKSGIAINDGVTVLNTPGTVDSSYRGAVCVILVNLGDKKYLVEKGKKIAQLVINKVEEAQVEIADDLDKTSRGAGGFGSTGLHGKKEGGQK